MNTKIDLSNFGINHNDYQLFLKRDDLLGKGISGNKLRKLKYNIAEAKAKGHRTILTFGGAYSNHIAAASHIKKDHHMDCIGIIRGEELSNKIELNPTLRNAQENGMRLHFITREAYRKKDTDEFIHKLKEEFGDFYLLPEGGTNPLAIKGCEEILTVDDMSFDIVCCAVGTGGTVSGIINSSKNNQNIIGFSALKGDFLSAEVSKHVQQENWDINNTYHFGGYAKITSDLVQFMNDFKSNTNITLDPIYNGKMLYGIIDLIKRGHFKKNTSILAIHTGGLQAIEGMNQRLLKKNLQTINL